MLSWLDSNTSVLKPSVSKSATLYTITSVSSTHMIKLIMLRQIHFVFVGLGQKYGPAFFNLRRFEISGICSVPAPTSASYFVFNPIRLCLESVLVAIKWKASKRL